jgi:FtsH-binding integral membrane protein
MIKSWRAMAPNVGYGLTVLATLFLGNIGLLLATIQAPEAAQVPHLMQIVALAIVLGLAAIFTGLNLNKRSPLNDRSAILWIWLLSLPVSRRLAEISLAVRWDQSMALEVALLAAAVVLVLMSAGRLAPEEAP